MVASLLSGDEIPDAADDAGAKRPKLAELPCASRSFCSSASARRFRKSERWTRPTVWDASRSAAVEAWVVKRELGVKTLGTSFDEGLDEAIQILSLKIQKDKGELLKMMEYFKETLDPL